MASTHTDFAPSSLHTGQTASRRRLAVGGSVVLILILLSILSLSLGSASLGSTTLSPLQLYNIIVNGDGERVTRIAVLELRLPRLIVGIIGGISLALAGCVLQDILRNDLAGPELLGVSAGASAVMASIFILQIFVAWWVSPWLALIGGLIAGGIVLFVTREQHYPAQMALVGVALTALFNAYIVFLISLGTDSQIELFLLFLAGSLANRTWNDILLLVPWALICIPLALLSARMLNLLRLGDDVAAGLGVNVLITRIILLVVVIAPVAALIAICGPIAYIALLAPLMTRRILATTNAYLVLPITALLGAVLLVAADLSARQVFAPAETPVGLWTTLIGVPILLLLLRLQFQKRTSMQPIIMSSYNQRLLTYPFLRIIVILIILLCGLGVLYLGVGRVAISPAEVVSALWAQTSDQTHRTIIWDLRLPRGLIAMIAGGMLGLSGAMLQSATRNTLAEPGLLGVSAGAVFLAVLWLNYAPTFPGKSVTLPFIALFGGLLSSSVIYVLSRYRRMEPAQMVLIGVLIGAALSSGTTLILLRNREALGGILLWLIGSLNGLTWQHWYIIGSGALVVIPLGCACAGMANALQLGDDIATGLGLRIERTRMILLGVGVLCASMAVAIVGAIGFVGLIGPHISRKLVGSDARRLFSLSALLTALLLISADLLAQAVSLHRLPWFALPPQTILPVGAVTNFIGAMFFLSLLRKR
jgi:iron complex transport system permease protein